MDINQIISKKLGVVATTVISLAFLVKDRPEIAGQVTWQMTIIVTIYIMIQGLIDLRKKGGVE